MIFRNDALGSKLIVVTGASSGLGRAVAIEASTLGASVILCGRNAEQLHNTLAQLHGTTHRVVAADTGSLDDMHAMIVDVAAQNGPINGLFHAAGTSGVRLAKTMSVSHVEAMFGAAVNGALGIAKAASKRNVMEDGGSIVFMSSVAAIRGKAGMVAYSAAKSAVHGLTRALAAELATRGIRVNEILAGAIETEMHEKIISSLDDAGVDAYRSRHPLGFGAPNDIASAATFLLSDAARWITGSSLSVDGGYSII